MISYRFKMIREMEKIFPSKQPKQTEEKLELSAFQEETVSFQILYYVDYSGLHTLDEFINFSVDAGTDISVQLRKVELVPSAFPCSGEHDEDYITTEPGLFPDLLKPYPAEGVRGLHKQWRAIWVDLTPNKKSSGERKITVSVRDEKGEEIWNSAVSLTVLPVCLPKQKLIHTEMFHADCLADYYGVEVFSEEHWAIIENFIQTAVNRGINMIFTPLFTPPMDTAVGGERTTVQLIKVRKTEQEYYFDFTLLERWILLCKKCNVSYIEMAPLFTQWGAKAAPKIIAEVEGEEKRIFGWETDADGKEYLDFLHCFLPQLRQFLKEQQVLDITWFHVSDEPSEEQLESYQSAHNCMEECLPDSPLFDALSSFSFYQKGIVTHPVVSSNHMEPFLEAGVKDLWAYYCCAQGVDVSNRFFAMPSYRNRILGVQLYLYEIKGFLHWGYNFYNSRYSISHINPYAITDSGESFPSGDPFLVYPGEGGKPYESIRLMILSEAMNDMRALQMLEGMTSREHVKQLIMGLAEGSITFKQYPRNSEFLVKLRAQVNKEIEALLSNQNR
jgi:hypothetical protein